MKANKVKAMAAVLAASLTLGLVPLPAGMLDKAGVTMTSEATAYGQEAYVSFSASSVDWVTDVGQEPMRALDRNPATIWRTSKKFTNSGGLYLQFYSQQKFAPTFYTITTAPDAATNPNRNPNSWTLYGQNSGGSWVALSTQTGSGGMQDINSATYQFNLPATGTKYNMYRIEFTALNSNVMAISDIRIYGNSFETADTEKKFTVSFNTDGGSRVSSEEVRYGNKVSEPSNPTKDGYRFTGWYTSRSLTTYYDFSRKVYDDMTLYAGWEVKTASNDATLKAQQEAAAAQQQAAAEKAAREKAEAEKAAAEKKAAEEKAAREKEEQELYNALLDAAIEQEAENERLKAELERKEAAAAESKKAEEAAAAQRAQQEAAQKAEQEAAARKAEQEAAAKKAEEEAAARRAEEEAKRAEEEAKRAEEEAARAEQERLEREAEEQARLEREAEEQAQLLASQENEDSSGENLESATVAGNSGAMAAVIALILAAAGGFFVWRKKKGTTEE